MRRYFVLLCLLCFCQPGNAAETARAVSTVPLSIVATYPLRSAPASVISLNEPVVAAQLNARLEQLLPLVGSRVKRNDVLARLDCREFELNSHAAEARLAKVEAQESLAQNRLRRARSLLADKLLSQEEVDIRSAELQALNADRRVSAAELDLARLRVERCTLRAPFDALVSERSAEVGQLLSPGTPVVKLMDLSQVEITASIVASDAEHITKTTEFELDANGKKYPVSLRAMVDAIDPTTRNRDVRFVFTGPAALTGSAGKILWRDPRPHVAANLLIERDGELGIFVVRNGSSVFVALENAKPGRSNPVNLPLDTAIVTDGYMGLSHGEPVISGR